MSANLKHNKEDGDGYLTIGCLEHSMLALGLGSIWKMTMKNLENDHGLAHKYCITAVSYCIALHNNSKIHPVLSYFVPDKLHFRLFCTENYIEIFAILWQYCYNDFFSILGYVSLLRY